MQRQALSWEPADRKPGWGERMVQGGVGTECQIDRESLYGSDKEEYGVQGLKSFHIEFALR